MSKKTPVTPVVSNKMCAGCASFNSARCPKKEKNALTTACPKYSTSMWPFVKSKHRDKMQDALLAIKALSDALDIGDSPQEIGKGAEAWQFFSELANQAAKANVRLRETPFRIFDYVYVQYRGRGEYLSNYTKMLLIDAQTNAKDADFKYSLTFARMGAEGIGGSVSVYHRQTRQFVMPLPQDKNRVLTEADWEVFSEQLIEEGRLVDPLLLDEEKRIKSKAQAAMWKAADGNRDMHTTIESLLADAALGVVAEESITEIRPAQKTLDTADHMIELLPIGDEAENAVTLSECEVLNLPDDNDVVDFAMSVLPLRFFVNEDGEPFEPEVELDADGNEQLLNSPSGLYAVPLPYLKFDSGERVVTGTTFDRGVSTRFYADSLLLRGKSKLPPLPDYLLDLANAILGE